MPPGSCKPSQVISGSWSALLSHFPPSSAPLPWLSINHLEDVDGHASRPSFQVLRCTLSPSRSARSFLPLSFSGSGRLPSSSGHFTQLRFSILSSLWYSILWLEA